MIRRAILALLLSAAPALAQAPNPGRPSWPSIIIGGSPISGVGTAPGTVAAGNDFRITGALQPGGTGDVSGMSVTPNAGAAAGTLARQLNDKISTQLPACDPTSTIAPVPSGQPFSCGGFVLIAQ